MTQLEIGAAFRASPKQNELARAWNDPAVTRLLASGAIRSGKTQAAGRLLVESALRFPAQYGVFRATYRELMDSTQRAMLWGDGELPPLIPPEAIAKKGYSKEHQRVTLVNGAEIVFRSLEEKATEKVRGLTLAAALVDQVEELRFEEGEHLYDELLGRVSDGRGPKKVMLIANPAGRNHWVFQRFIHEPDPKSAVVHFSLFDNEMNLDPEYVTSMKAMKDTRPGWYRTFVLGEWGALEDAAYIIEPDHRIHSFHMDDAMFRFEAADYGFNGAPWCLWTVDYDGNLIAYDMLYERDLLPSELAPLVLAKRQSWGEGHVAYMDPSVWKRTGGRNRIGAPATLASEFIENGLVIVPANNDPRAGMARLRELLKLDAERRFPSWHPKAGEYGCPRVFFTEDCNELVEELRSAELQPLDKRNGGEMVDPVWESRNGHAAAMARYAAMARASASDLPEEEISDPRQRALAKMIRDEEERDRWRDEYGDPYDDISNWT